MKKYVFELFNVKNNIFLDFECVNYIAEQCKTEENVIKILQMYIKAFKNKKVSISELQMLFKKSKKLFEINATIQNIEKYDVLYEMAIKTVTKNKSNENSLIEIEKLKTDTISFIFGLIYKNKNNEYCLKDKTGKITLNILECLQEQKINVFFITGMFLVVKGTKINNYFVVADILTPEIEKDTKIENTSLMNTDFSALIFNKAINFVTLNEILASFDAIPEIVIMNIETSKDLKFIIQQEKIFVNSTVIYIINSNIYLENLEIINKIKTTFTVDFCNLQFYNRILTFQNSNFYNKIMSNGAFIGQNTKLMLAKSLSSQYSSNFIDDHLEMLSNKQDVFLIFSDFTDFF